jgi:hypothetical protein
VATATLTCVGPSKFMGFVRVEGCVNPSEDYISSASSGDCSNFVAPESIRGVNADADDVAVFNLNRVYSSQSLIDKVGITEDLGRCRRKHI